MYVCMYVSLFGESASPFKGSQGCISCSDCTEAKKSPARLASPTKTWCVHCYFVQPSCPDCTKARAEPAAHGALTAKIQNPSCDVMGTTPTATLRPDDPGAQSGQQSYKFANLQNSSMPESAAAAIISQLKKPPEAMISQLKGKPYEMIS